MLSTKIRIKIERKNSKKDRKTYRIIAFSSIYYLNLILSQNSYFFKILKKK